MSVQLIAHASTQTFHSACNAGRFSPHFIERAFMVRRALWRAHCRDGAWEGAQVQGLLPDHLDVHGTVILRGADDVDRARALLHGLCAGRAAHLRCRRSKQAQLSQSPLRSRGISGGVAGSAAAAQTKRDLMQRLRVLMCVMRTC